MFGAVTEALDREYFVHPGARSASQPLVSAGSGCGPEWLLEKPCLGQAAVKLEVMVRQRCPPELGGGTSSICAGSLGQVL